MNKSAIVLNLAEALRHPGDLAPIYLVLEELVGVVTRLEREVADLKAARDDARGDCPADAPTDREWASRDWATFDRHLAEVA